MVEEEKVNLDNVYYLKDYRIFLFVKHFVEDNFGIQCKLSLSNPDVREHVTMFNKRKITLMDLYFKIADLSIYKNNRELK